MPAPHEVPAVISTVGFDQVIGLFCERCAAPVTPVGEGWAHTEPVDADDDCE